MSATDPTNAELLVAVRAAIYAMMSGGAVQSYSIGGRNLQRCSLAELRELEKHYQAQVDAGRGRTTNYAEFGDSD